MLPLSTHATPPQVTVLADATASATPEVQAANLFDIQKIGVDTPSVADWAAQLVAAAAAAEAAT